MKKTVLRSFLLVVALAAIGAQSGAQVIGGAGSSVESPRGNILGLGVFGGMTSGVGLSFRHHLPNPVSYTISGGIIKDTDLNYDIGGELQFDFGRTPGSRVFGVVGLGYYYAGSDDKNDLAAPFRCGLGVGGEVALGSALHLSLDILFTYFSDGTILPLPQAGLYFYFY